MLKENKARYARPLYLVPIANRFAVKLPQATATDSTELRNSRPLKPHTNPVAGARLSFATTHNSTHKMVYLDHYQKPNTHQRTETRPSTGGLKPRTISAKGGNPPAHRVLDDVSANTHQRTRKEHDKM